MAKNKLFFLAIGAVSGLLLTAFFFTQLPIKKKSNYYQSKQNILLSYIPPLEYVGDQEYLSQVSLAEPKIFDESGYIDALIELESLNPIIDSVIYIPEQFKFKQKA